MVWTSLWEFPRIDLIRQARLRAHVPLEGPRHELPEFNIPNFRDTTEVSPEENWISFIYRTSGYSALKV